MIATWPRKPMSSIWYAQLTLNSVALVPSVIFCPQMPQRLLSMHLFFHVLIIETLSFLAALSISRTNYRRFRTTLLAFSWEFLKLITFFFILLLFIGCSLIYGCSTTSHLSALIASARLPLTPKKLTELLRIYKPIRQLRLSSDCFILCLPSVGTFPSFSYTPPSVWNTVPYEIRSSNTLSSFKWSLKTYFF